MGSTPIFLTTGKGVRQVRNPKSKTHNRFSVGTARVDVTPPLTIPYLDVVPRHSFFTGVHDPLYAKAVVVGDGMQRVALVTVDSIGIARRVAGRDRDFIAEVRQLALERCGIPPESIMVCATHAHSTPDLVGFRPLDRYPGALSWLDTLRDQLASVIAMADQRREPAHLKIGRGTVTELGTCRRILGREGSLYHWRTRPPDDEVADWGITDDEVVVLSFERPDGTVAAVLFHFMCHPTTVQTQPLASADFPGVACGVVEQAVGCEHALFFQGACGATVPIRMTTDFDDVLRYGHMLGGEVIKQVARMSAPDYPCEKARVDCAHEPLALASRPLPEAGPIEEEFNAAKEALEQASEEDRQQKAAAFKAAEETWERVRLGAGPFHSEAQVMRLGDLALAANPGEPFPEFSVAFKQAESPLHGALCMGYANDYLGYLAPQSAWDVGGYEVNLGMWSIVGPKAFDILMQGTQRLVRNLWS